MKNKKFIALLFACMLLVSCFSAHAMDHAQLAQELIGQWKMEKLEMGPEADQSMASQMTPVLKTIIFSFKPDGTVLMFSADPAYAGMSQTGEWTIHDDGIIGTGYLSTSFYWDNGYLVYDEYDLYYYFVRVAAGEELPEPGYTPMETQAPATAVPPTATPIPRMQTEDGNYISGDYEYALSETGEATILKYKNSGNVSTLLLPSELDGAPVTALADRALAGAFWSDRLFVSVHIPASITTIGVNPFINSSGISAVTVDENHPTLQIIDGALFSIPDQRLIFCPTGAIPSTSGFYADGKVPENAGSFTVPEGTRSIDEEAFYACRKRLEMLQLPNTLETIGSRSFYECKLKTLVIPESVTYVGTDAFHGCNNLTSVTITGGNVTLDESAFIYCKKLESVTLSEGVNNIGHGAFANCPKLTVTLVPGSYAEQYCQKYNIRYTYE